MSAWTIIGLSVLLGLGLLTIMGRLCGRNPGAIGPEIDSPFFDANVDSLLDAKLVATIEPVRLVTHTWAEI